MILLAMLLLLREDKYSGERVISALLDSVLFGGIDLPP